MGLVFVVQYHILHATVYRRVKSGEDYPNDYFSYEKMFEFCRNDFGRYFVSPGWYDLCVVDEYARQEHKHAMTSASNCVRSY